ncbi:MAG: amidohydrolase family protein [Clostridia bacterium]|nr:amidohydrolase family protein [Clostridia bacterium]
MIAIINAKILTVTNGTIENGALLVEEGKIAGYGADIQIPEGAEIIDAKGGWLTPGLIDAHTHMCVFGEPNTMPGLQGDGNEGSSPITPELDAVYALNPHDISIEKVRNAGFTTCYTGPGSANVIGGTGVTFKLRGNSPEEMEIPGHRHMKMALGENPKRFYGTNKKVAPWTRMGTGALLRKWLQMAKNYSDELIAFEKGEGKKPNYDFQLEALVPVVRGEMKARIHAHRADDIETAIRISHEFNLDFSVEHATEGYKIIDILKENKVDVIIGPLIPSWAKMETWGRMPETAGVLNEAGINVMLTADKSSATAHLPMEIGYCMARGLKFDDALEGITIRPARFLGVGDKVGSIEIGKDADIAIFNGNPFENFTLCKLTMIDGVVYKNEL